MFCHKCGTKMPDEAKFCSNCGTALAKETNTVTAKYETCQIEYQTILGFGNILTALFTSSSKMRLYAKAFSPTGTYVAAETDIFTCDMGAVDSNWNKEEQEHQILVGRHELTNAYDKLVTQLLADGWERTGNKFDVNRWYTDIFRRQIK